MTTKKSIKSADFVMFSLEVPTWTVQPSQPRGPVSSQPTVREKAGS